MSQVVVLQNEFWQVGLLPETGASIAFARARRGPEWLDVMRPTAEADYGSPGRCSSFIMLPWCNRIRGGLLRFGDETFPLRTASDDGTARHGDVRQRPWQTVIQSAERIGLTLDSRDHPDMNFPFRFSARAIFWLERRDLALWLSLKNEDSRPFPAGFGHHPYFVRPPDEAAPVVEIPCSWQFNLTGLMADSAPVPVTEPLDFRAARPLDTHAHNHLLTGRHSEEAPARITYPDRDLSVAIYADLVFHHFLLFTPDEPAFALEPMTNASDGFNLFARGIPGSGVFVLLPGEEKGGIVRLRLSGTG
jgi:aldose 1-epimerase